MDAVAMVEQTFNIRLQRVTDGEWRSVQGCPECGDGGKGSRSDRFRVFTDGSPRYWCRRCGLFGWLDELDGESWRDLSPEERRRRKLRGQQERRKAEAREAVLRRQALAELRQSGDADRYHQQLLLTPHALNYWFAEGLNAETIDRYNLGYCEACPLDRQHRPSVTIPVYSRGYLWNIRHRILGAKPGDKYRPHAKHLPKYLLFNADNLFGQPQDYILLVEGEKKAMAASQAGWRNVGIMGQDVFTDEWLGVLQPFDNVFVVLDPDAIDRAREIAVQIGPNARAVQLREKLDDLLNPYKFDWPAEQVWGAIAEPQEAIAEPQEAIAY